MKVFFQFLLLIALEVFFVADVDASGFDWEISETPSNFAVTSIRNVRDGTLEIVDSLMDLNTSVFGEGALLLSKVLMLGSDGVGLIDDNPVTQHVTKSVISKPLAKTAYFWHMAGSEAVLGGHGMEIDRWAVEAMVSMNPLLGDEDLEALEPVLPLDPLEFVEEGMIHTYVYTTHSTILGLGAVILSDALLRPSAGVLRIFQFSDTADTLEQSGNDLVRKSSEIYW